MYFYSEIQSVVHLHVSVKVQFGISCNHMLKHSYCNDQDYEKQFFDFFKSFCIIILYVFPPGYHIKKKPLKLDIHD